jgi:Fe-Mn family superoxide dismutase
MTTHMNRRAFMKTAAAGVAVAGVTLSGLGSLAHAESFDMPALPYADDALEPVISARTISFHYGKHHSAYYAKANKMVPGSKYEGMRLEEISAKAADDPTAQGIFNNVAQAFNHDFYWNGMKPGGGGKPTGKIAEAIDRDFGGYEGFREAFMGAAGVFGSGYAWLMQKDGVLMCLGFQNAENPLGMGARPLFTVDVWEHAYYLDWQNRRGDYVAAVLDKLVDWDFVNANLA